MVGVPNINCSPSQILQLVVTLLILSGVINSLIFMLLDMGLCGPNKTSMEQSQLVQTG